MIPPWKVSSDAVKMILPAPRHCGQFCWMLKKPWRMCTVPAPLQVLQVLALVPGLAPEPLQVSATSQAPADPRHVVPAVT